MPESGQHSAEVAHHLGVDVGTPEEVGAAQVRLAEEGLATASEEGVDCCYARQDKIWVDGPSGETWEIYAVLEHVEMAEGQLRTPRQRWGCWASLGWWRWQRRCRR